MKKGRTALLLLSAALLVTGCSKVSANLKNPDDPIVVDQNGNADSLINRVTEEEARRVKEDPNEPVHVVLGANEFDISPNAARNVALLIAVIVIAPVLAAFIAIPMFAQQKQTQLDDTKAKLEQTNAEIKRIQDEQNRANDFDVNAEIKKVMTNNRSKLMGYSALGEAVPKKVFLTYFTAADDGNFDIKGESDNVEDIYVFFKNMKDSLISTQLRLHKLEMKSDSVDEAVTIDPNQPTAYEFEITNMSTAALNRLEKALAEKAKQAAEGKGDDKKDKK